MKKRYIILLLLVLCLASLFGVWNHQHSFTKEKWTENPEQRTKIVDDLLEDHLRIGMTKEEVLALLGGNESGGEVPIIPEGDQWVYWMGSERGLISIDSEWLLVEFQDDLVAGYDIVTD